MTLDEFEELILGYFDSRINLNQPNCIFLLYGLSEIGNLIFLGDIIYTSKSKLISFLLRYNDGMLLKFYYDNMNDKDCIDYIEENSVFLFDELNEMEMPPPVLFGVVANNFFES